MVGDGQTDKVLSYFLACLVPPFFNMPHVFFVYGWWILHQSRVQTARTFPPPSPATLLERSRVTVGLEVAMKHKATKHLKAMIYNWPMKPSGDRLSQSEDCCESASVPRNLPSFSKHHIFQLGLHITEYVDCLLAGQPMPCIQLPDVPPGSTFVLLLHYRSE